MSAVVAALVRDALSQSASVTAIVASRIYSSYRPGTALPAILLTYGDDKDVSPTFSRTDTLRRMTVTIDCIASTLKVSRELAEACRKAVHGASGYYRSTTVFEIRAESTSTEYDLGSDATDDQAHVTTVQAQCTYRAPAVTPTTITDPGGVP